MSIEKYENTSYSQTAKGILDFRFGKKNYFYLFIQDYYYIITFVFFYS
jgi:hypothetical protein